MSALDRAIWYFDLQLALGVGQMAYDSQVQLATNGPALPKTATGYNFDLTAQVFFSRHFAFRLDLKKHLLMLIRQKCVNGQKDKKNIFLILKYRPMINRFPVLFVGLVMKKEELF